MSEGAPLRLRNWIPFGVASGLSSMPLAVYMIGTGYRNARVLGGLLGFASMAAMVVIGMVELAFLIAILPYYRQRERKRRLRPAFLGVCGAQLVAMACTALARALAFARIASAGGVSVFRFWKVQDWLLVCGGIGAGVALIVVAANLRRRQHA